MRLMRNNIGTFFLFALGILLTPSLASAASTTSPLYPTATGTLSQWKANTAVPNWSTVDEASCNGVTDYASSTTVGKRDSYSISLSSIPDSAMITSIFLVPCASRDQTGVGSTQLDVFYKYNGATSSDKGAYAPPGTTPSALATSSWQQLTHIKTSTSTFEIGMGYTSGTKGGRLSRITAQLAYQPVPSATTSAATSIATTTALLNGSANPNGSSTAAWFRISATSPGTCNDTFGTRVPSSGSTSLGAGTSGVAYSTTTTGLSQNTTYYYCAIASNGAGKGYGSVQSFNSSTTVNTISADISTNTTWNSSDGTYLINGAIAVNSGVTLTINAGTVVKFQTGTSKLTIDGTLNAQGSSGSKIYFTAYADDSIGGDTNSDGASSGAAGAIHG